jgi:hypothetical protein
MEQIRPRFSEGLQGGVAQKTGATSELRIQPSILASAVVASLSELPNQEQL